MPKDIKLNRVYMWKSALGRRVCSVGANKMLVATRWVNGKVICPSCRSYCLKRVYLNSYRDFIIPSLARGARCQTLLCTACQTKFQVTVECHPDCKNRVDCLTGVVNVVYTLPSKKEAPA